MSKPRRANDCSLTDSGALRLPTLLPQLSSQNTELKLPGGRLKFCHGESDQAERKEPKILKLRKVRSQLTLQEAHSPLIQPAAQSFQLDFSVLTLS